MDKLPDDVLWKIFSYVRSAEDLCRCARVCRRWNRLLDATSEAWSLLLVECTPPEFRDDPLLKDVDSPKAKLAVFACAWSDSDRSENIYIKENKLTLHRKPVAQSTDAIRGKTGFSSGQHYWTVVWHGPNFGSSAVIGLATKKCELHGEGYFSLLGRNSESWGWDLSQNVLRHDGEALGKYPHQETKVRVGQKIGVTLDMTALTLAFDVDGKYFGIAFRDLPRVPLYPAVSAVYGNSEISLVYHGSPFVG